MWHLSPLNHGSATGDSNVIILKENQEQFSLQGNQIIKKLNPKLIQVIPNNNINKTFLSF